MGALSLCSAKFEWPDGPGGGGRCRAQKLYKKGSAVGRDAAVGRGAQEHGGGGHPVRSRILVRLLDGCRTRRGRASSRGRPHRLGGPPSCSGAGRPARPARNVICEQPEAPSDAPRPPEHHRVSSGAGGASVAWPRPQTRPRVRAAASSAAPRGRHARAGRTTTAVPLHDTHRQTGRPRRPPARGPCAHARGTTPPPSPHTRRTRSGAPPAAPVAPGAWPDP